MTVERKAAILDAMREWVYQRPGLEFGNYGDVSSYRSEMRAITRDRHDFDVLCGAVARSGVTADELVAAFPRAFAGRLELCDVTARYADGSEWVRYALSYTTGQYWPTEYRKAACAVLVRALWTYYGSCVAGVSSVDRPGDVIRRTLRNVIGSRGVVRRWVDNA